MSAPRSDLPSPDSTKEQSDGHGSHNDEKTEQTPAAETPKNPSKIKALWTKIGLDWLTLRTMIKAGIAPAICLAFYQADAVADEFSTIGYLVAIASLLALPIMPRAKFLENMLINVFTICFCAALSILATWSGVQARINTGGAPAGYSSSAAAVCGVWLFFQVWMINMFRSARPQYVFPGILSSIFAVVSLTNGHVFPNTAYCLSFASRLLTAFLTGFAIATGVSLLIFPLSSREVIFKELTGFATGMQGLIKAQLKYMQALEEGNIFRDKKPEAEAIQGIVGGLKALQGKIVLDMPFAKRDVGYGKLSASSISELYRQMRSSYLAILGMTQIVDVIKRVAELGGFNLQDSEASEEELRAVREWQNLMHAVHEPFPEIMNAMVDALEHVMLVLDFKKNRQTDAEAQGPGSPEFVQYYEKKMNAFMTRRHDSLKGWCSRKGLDSVVEKLDTHAGATASQRSQRQLLILLYLEWLLQETSENLLELIKFADKKAASDKHIILPGFKRTKKWVLSIFRDKGPNELEETEQDHEYFLGEALRGRKDPEHLKPTNAWQKYTNGIRAIPAFFRSEHCAFGFRVACAVMSICIVAYLKTTWEFFIAQRLFWSAIMTAISMNRLAGQSLFGFCLRVIGTTIAMAASFVIYYIVDGHIAGVLVFEYIWICCAFYIIVKYPKFTPVGIISAITTVLIIGYELQVDKIGVVLATSNRQNYYPIYQLAPYRLATVAGGLLVAYIWTIFPYAISENTEIRKDLGAIMYMLAHHYSIVHETVTVRVRGEDEGDPLLKTSPGRQLQKARLDSFTKQTGLIARLRVNSAFQQWSINLGGRFPRERYDACITYVDNILSYSSLIAYSSKTFTIADESLHVWQADLRKLRERIETTSNDVTTRLCVLSHCLSNAMPLPPHLTPLEPYALLRELDSIDRDILSIDHAAEPGYAAFAVMQIASRTVINDLNKLTDAVRELVGELDFSFHESHTSSAAHSSEQLNGNIDDGGQDTSKEDDTDSATRKHKFY